MCGVEGGGIGKQIGGLVWAGAKFSIRQLNRLGLISRSIDFLAGYLCVLKSYLYVHRASI